jgi:hypothetical protein
MPVMQEPLNYARPQEQYVTARKQMTDKWALEFAIWLAKVILLFALLFGLLVLAILGMPWAFSK